MSSGIDEEKARARGQGIYRCWSKAITKTRRTNAMNELRYLSVVD